jgi:hypothetical protein
MGGACICMELAFGQTRFSKLLCLDVGVMIENLVVVQLRSVPKQLCPAVRPLLDL